MEIRITSVTTDSPLPYDIYLIVNSKPILFRKRLDHITDRRMVDLIRHGGEVFLVPTDQRAIYLQSLKEKIRDPDTSTATKSRLLKESAFVHIHDLFTKQDVSTVVTEAQSLVEEMVHFVSTDVAAITNLMGLSVHDYYTYNHCVDVAVYSIALAKKLLGDDKTLLINAGLGGLLHDIGKRRLEWAIINKATPLTELEWKEIKKHPDHGKEILENIHLVPDQTKLAVYEHHENFDGTGYPRGIKEDTISNVARIVSIADVFDALTTDRSYHKAVPTKEALNTMFSMQPGKFDPNIFKSFNKNFDKKTPFTFSQDFDPCQPQQVRIVKK